MKLREALQQMRAELNMKQADLAYMLNLNVATVSRWETGKNWPNRSISIQLLHLAQGKGASTVCLAALNEALFPTVHRQGIDDLKYARMDQINQLVNDSSNGVFVCDMETREMLYANQRLARMTGQSIDSADGKKCYEYLLHRDRPCDHCKIQEYDPKEFATCEMASPTSKRYYMLRGKKVLWNGKPAHLEYITDITDIHQVRQELDRSQELMTAAFKAAGLWAFTIDLQTDVGCLMPEAQRLFHVPKLIPGFWQQVRSYGVVEAEDWAKLESVIQKLRHGEAQAETVVYATIPGGKAYWVRMRAKVFSWDPLGKPQLAVCSVQNINSEKAIEARFRLEHEHILNNSKDLLSYVISNISQNRVIEHRRLQDDAPDIIDSPVYDQTILQTLSSVVPKSSQERFERLHQRETLLESFDRGELAISESYQIRRTDDSLLWIRTEMKLHSDPESGDLYLYEYCFADHARKIMNGLLAVAMANEYDFFGAVSVLNGQMTRLSLDIRQDGQTEFVSYMDNIQAYCRRYVLPEERAAFLEHTALSHVVAQMNQNTQYLYRYRTVDEKGNIRTKLSRFSWFDQEQRFCLLGVMDLERLTELANGAYDSQA